MARLVDALHPPETRRTREPIEKPAAPVTAPLANPTTPADDEDSEVPFIEVGAPTMKHGNLKPARDSAPVATILPLTRPTPAERESQPARPAPAEAFPLYRISFQPLPFARESTGPAERRFARELVAFHQPDHPVAEQYRDLLHELEAQLGSEPGKSLLFTAAHPAAGTTTVLLNLAIACARGDRTRVAVVDANFSRPAVANRLGIAPAPGLRELLSRTVPLVWALQETGLPNLSALVDGQSTGEPDITAWPMVLEQLKQRFDWVLVDAAEWGHLELPALSGKCSATYLVLGQADFAAPELNDMLAEIPRHGGQLRGYILAQRNR